MIVGNKVILKAIENEDQEYVYKWRNDTELMELFDFTMIFSNYSMVGKDILNNKSSGILEFLIAENITNRPVGMCKLSNIDYINKKCNCSLFIGDAECRGFGYGTEAMKLLVKFAFEDLNLNRVGLWVFDFNKRAIKSYKKCGMKVEGIMREGIYRNGKYHDVYLMGILKQEYMDIRDKEGEACLEVNL